MSTEGYPELVVFTDLDGTLLDYDGYSPAPALHALGALLAAGAALVFCSSKTLAEQRALQTELGVRDPMIVENGSAVLIPRGCFPEPLDPGPGAPPVHRSGRYDVIVLGSGRRRVLADLNALRQLGLIFYRGYADMTLEEVGELTRLPEAGARRARRRAFSETVFVPGGADGWRRFMDALGQCGLHSFGDGPTGTVVAAGADKGRAVAVLTGMYRRALSASRPGRDSLLTVGIGDGANDEPMLRAVDRAFLVERTSGGWADLSVDGLERVDGVGPRGWSRAAARIMEGGIAS